MGLSHTQPLPSRSHTHSLTHGVYEYSGSGWKEGGLTAHATPCNLRLLLAQHSPCCAVLCRLVDEVVWVKMTVNRRVFKSHGYYLQHAKEVCMVARKNPPTPQELQQQQQQQPQGQDPQQQQVPRQQRVREQHVGRQAHFHATDARWGSSGSSSGGGGDGLRPGGFAGVSSDIIFSERRGQSQKPEEIYELIESLVPNGEGLARGRGGGWEGRGRDSLSEVFLQGFQAWIVC